METLTGIIVAIHCDRNYGFIDGDDGERYFFHRMGVVNSTFEELREGMPVSFLATDSKKGIRAIGVVLM